MTAPRIATLTGSEILPALPALAALRTAVFRDWPYLYDGDEAYERDYLRAYADSRRAMLAVAYDGASVIGASTCMPLVDAAAEIRDPVAARGLDPAAFFYFGESVLLMAYRGLGLGVAFFAAREAHAIADGVCDYALFYAVRRAPDHPARPTDAASLEPFWRRRGFHPIPGLNCHMEWKEIASTAPVTNTLDAWCKPLRQAPPLS
jgi:GNAT superfamily N-acetyltransferase